MLAFIFVAGRIYEVPDTLGLLDVL